MTGSPSTVRPETIWLGRAESLFNRRTRVIGGITVLCGLLWRLYYASDFYLNPDEGLHYLVAVHPWHGWIGFYLNAVRVVHPPLFIAVLQAMLLFGRSELLLRFVASLAGSLFPFFVMLWVQRFAGNAAGLCAQLLLTFSPTLIDISSEVRAYSLAFLFFSISLLFLEKALDDGSTWLMVWFHFFLYLAILTEYSVAWFVAALGVYALLRIWKSHAKSGVWVTWLLGQVGALGLYVFLYFTQITRFSYAGLQGMYHSPWLLGAFPQLHENLFLFAVKGTFRQFRYLFQSRWLAGIGLVGFLLGLQKLWREKSSSYAILVILPFLLACLGAVFYLYPYGASRHTAVLDIAIAVGIGVTAASLMRNRIFTILMAACPFILLWHSLSPGAYLDITPERRHLREMREAIDFMRNQVPSGSLIVTDLGTDHILGYYLACPDYGYYDSDETYRLRQCGDLHIIVAPSFEFSDSTELGETLSQVRAKYHPDHPVWVVAGGFHISVANSISDSRPFGKTVAIFQISESSTTQSSPLALPEIGGLQPTK